jgi:general stress protein YciG
MGKFLFNQSALLPEYGRASFFYRSVQPINFKNENMENSNLNGEVRDAKTSNRGLASADPETRKAVARKGGVAVSKNREHMASIGRKGGQTVSQDRAHMSQIGRKGGEAVSRDRQHMSEIGRKGGENSRATPEQA